MVFDLIVSVMVNVLGSVLSLFSWTAPSAVDVTAGAYQVGNAAAWGTQIFPVSTCCTFIAAGAAFDLTMTGVQVAIMVYRLIPFKAS